MTDDPWLPQINPPPPPARRCTKNRYPDKKAAVSQINVVMRRRHNRPSFLRPYYCHRCKAWHLTHRE